MVASRLLVPGRSMKGRGLGLLLDPSTNSGWGSDDNEGSRGISGVRISV